MTEIVAETARLILRTEAPGDLDRWMDRACALGDFAPGGRHQNRLPVALDQLRAEHRFEFLETGAQRRLGDKTRFCSASEIELLRERDQVLQLFERWQGGHGENQSYRYNRSYNKILFVFKLAVFWLKFVRTPDTPGDGHEFLE